jgi:hypothetical protein
MEFDPGSFFSALSGCVAGVAAMRIEIKFLWRDVRLLKKKVGLLMGEVTE